MVISLHGFCQGLSWSFSFTTAQSRGCSLRNRRSIELTSGGLRRYYLLLQGGIVSEFHVCFKGCGTQL